MTTTICGPHRCAWCRAKLARVAPLPIDDGRWACKPRCRDLYRRWQQRAAIPPRPAPAGATLEAR